MKIIHKRRRENGTRVVQAPRKRGNVRVRTISFCEKSYDVPVWGWKTEGAITKWQEKRNARKRKAEK